MFHNRNDSVSELKGDIVIKMRLTMMSFPAFCGSLANFKAAAAAAPEDIPACQKNDTYS